MPASEPSDPSSWRLRPSMPPHSNPIAPRTSFAHTLPSQQHPRPLQQPLPSQHPLNPHQPLPSHQPQSLPSHPTFPPQHSLSLPSALPSSTHYQPRPSSHIPSQQSSAMPADNSRIPTASGTNRKRQFRFSVVADIELLQLVANYNPYAAAHGGRLHKWQAIADTLRDVGIDIDFRRARDRTALLIDQWRKQEFALLRRSGSGNQQDQAEKERLLDIISGMEHAAKPRDHPSEWRPSQHQFVHNTSDPPVVGPPSLRPVDSPDNAIVPSSNAPAVDDQVAAHPLPHPSGASGANAPSNDHSQSNTNDNASLTAAVSRPYSTSLAPVGVGPLPATSTIPATTNLNDCNPPRTTALPPLLPQREVVTNIDNNPMHPSPYNPSQPMYPEKLVKTNNGKRLGSHLAHSFSPSTPLNHEHPKRKSDLAIASHHDAQATLPSNHYAHSSLCPPSTQRMEAPASVANMATRHIANGQNVQLEAQARDRSGAQSQHIETHDTIGHLYSFLVKLDNKLDRMLSTMTKQIEMEERRFAWEKECEKKRLQAKQERMEKEYMDREVAREERRQEQLRHQEERDLLFEIISRGRHQVKTKAGQPG